MKTGIVATVLSMDYHVQHANPSLTSLIDQTIGEGWKTDADQLEKLLDHYNDEEFLGKMDAIKQDNKKRFASFIRKTQNIDIDPDSIFDIQVKRMHEYKRQQMNALWVIYKYLQIKRGQKPVRPITVIFGGKAAPAYYQAKCTLPSSITSAYGILALFRKTILFRCLILQVCLLHYIL